MILDDHLGLWTLAGRRAAHWEDGVPAIPWGFHFRLVRAVIDFRRRGRLTRELDFRVARIAAAPPVHVLRILDPRQLTVTAARLTARYPLSMVAAELLAAGKVHAEPVHVAADNLGRTWHHVAAAEGIDLRVEPAPPA
ncbi:MAG: hypothetical protein OXH20_09100 [bacterium]|nr:hypothetical protein [bacterium]